MVSSAKERKRVLPTFGSFTRIASSLGCLDSVFADIVLVSSSFLLAV